MNEQDLRDVFAMFGLVGLIMKHGDGYVAKIAEKSYEIADAMLEARKPKEEVGITAIKRGRKKSND